MRVGVLCGSSARSMYVANALCERLDVACVISEIGWKRSFEAIRKNLRASALRTRFGRKIRQLLHLPDINQDNFFFPDHPPRFESSAPLVRVAHINDSAVECAMRQFNVDTLAVFGTSLLKRTALFELADGRIINLHGGLSPWYRGADSTFWALYNRDIEHVGCTIHFVNHRADAGALISHVCPEIEGGERELLLTCKAIRRAADLMPEALLRLDAGEPLGAKQPAGGKLYRARDRRSIHDRAVRQMFIDGQLGRETHPERIRWFSDDGERNESIADAASSEPELVRSNS